MQCIADFHIHSRYAYATSQTMNLPMLALWAKFKGIEIIGTGDFTHPLWQAELYEYLQESEPGLFTLKKKYVDLVQDQCFSTCAHVHQRFILSTEISLMFKRNGVSRKLHVLVLAPSFEVVEKISQALGHIGNIVSDGRPILSLDVIDFMHIVFDISPECMVIPAHIWTPHFGALGSRSGFNSMQDCFGEMEQYIFAFEKGLSSSFLMNGQLSQLDRYTIIANSDAHSLQNLGREANLLDLSEYSYAAITNALKRTSSIEKYISGIEFFPERGKYFGNGHRACNVYATFEQTQDYKGVCPVCKKKLTIGVYDRVVELADRTIEQACGYAKPARSILPLLDIIAFVLNVQTTAKKVNIIYMNMLATIGPEFYILLHASFDHLAMHSSKEIAQAICAIRQGQVQVAPGYDGVYGKIEIINL
jgi:uncharacterized protein (TIGR00375 family)